MPNRVLLVLAGVVWIWPATAAEPSEKAVLWRDPQDLSSRNLYYGPGGAQDQPTAPFRFVQEDPEGTNPKFLVEDAHGVRWTAKLGAEARPETVVTRIVWAAGYFANEDYVVPEFRAEDMPARLHRGQGFVRRDGSILNVRLKRHSPEDKKIGSWPWKQSPFVGTREFNGLRALMALVNNWDLTDENNEVVERSGERIYLVSDVGSTLGSGNLTWPLRKGRGDLGAYAHSKFIDGAHGELIDFHEPPRPALWFLFTPREYLAKARLRWIGRGIPRADARWLGQILRRISNAQMRDAFRAAGYSAREVDEGVAIIERRIAELEDL